MRSIAARGFVGFALCTMMGVIVGPVRVAEARGGAHGVARAMSSVGARGPVGVFAGHVPRPVALGPSTPRLGHAPAGLLLAAPGPTWRRWQGVRVAGGPVVFVPTVAAFATLPSSAGSDESGAEDATVGDGSDGSPSSLLVVDDDWLRGAAGWIAEADDAAGCFERLGSIAEQGQKFLASQAAWLIPVCGDGAEAMLQAISLVAPYIVDPAQAAARIVPLFTASRDQTEARALLRDAGIDAP